MQAKYCTLVVDVLVRIKPFLVEISKVSKLYVGRGRKETRNQTEPICSAAFINKKIIKYFLCLNF